jgi:hypothetical protein
MNERYQQGSAPMDIHHVENLTINIYAASDETQELLDFVRRAHDKEKRSEREAALHNLSMRENNRD